MKRRDLLVGYVAAKDVGLGRANQWDSYVRDNLLSRLFGFELLMAPYAIAPLKPGLEL